MLPTSPIPLNWTAPASHPTLTATWQGIDEASFRKTFRSLYRRIAADGAAFQLPARRSRTHAGAPLLIAAVFVQQQSAGYCMLREEEPGSLRLLNTGFAEAYRGMGLYGALLAALLPWAQSAGFAQVVSRHRADHNALLIAKLRAGFVLSGCRVDPRFGVQAELVHPFSSNTRDMLAYRIGSKRIDDRLAAHWPKVTAGSTGGKTK